MEVIQNQFPDDINELKLLLIDYAEENAALKSLLSERQIQHNADVLNEDNQEQLTKIRLNETLQRVKVLESQVNQQNQRIQDLNHLNEHLLKQQTYLDSQVQNKIFQELFGQLPSEAAQQDNSNDIMLRIIAEISTLQSIKRKYSRIKKELTEAQHMQAELLQKFQENCDIKNQQTESETITYLESQLEHAEQNIQHLKKEIFIYEDKITQLEKQNAQLLKQVTELQQCSAEIELQGHVAQSLYDENIQLKQEVVMLRETLKEICDDQTEVNQQNKSDQNQDNLNKCQHYRANNKINIQLTQEQQFQIKQKKLQSSETKQQDPPQQLQPCEFTSKVFEDVIQQLDISKIFNNSSKSQQQQSNSTLQFNGENNARQSTQELKKPEQNDLSTQQKDNNAIIPFSLNYSKRNKNNLKENHQMDKQDIISEKAQFCQPKSNLQNISNSQQPHTQRKDEDKDMIKQSQLISQLIENMEQAHRILNDNEQFIQQKKAQPLDQKDKAQQQNLQYNDEQDLHLSQLRKGNSKQENDKNINPEPKQAQTLKENSQQNTPNLLVKQYSEKYRELNARFEKLQRKIMNQ